MLLVDTSVWSLALRRDIAATQPEVWHLQQALLGEQTVVTTGLVLQELLQGFSGPKARGQIIDCFSSLPLVQPDRQDHVDAAALRTKCRQGGVRIGTIDALLLLRSNTIIDYTAAGEPELRVCCSRVEDSSARLLDTTVRHFTPPRSAR